MNKLSFLSISLLMVIPVVASDKKPVPAAGGAMSRMGTRVTARAQATADKGRQVQSPTDLLKASNMVATVNPKLSEELREEAVTKITPEGRISAAQQKAAPLVAQQNFELAKSLAQEAFVKYNEDKDEAQELWNKAQKCWSTAQLATVKIASAVPFGLQELLTNSLEQTQGFAIRGQQLVEADNNELVTRFSILQVAADETSGATASTAAPAATASTATDTRGKQTRMAVAGVLAKIGAKKMARAQLDTTAEKYDSATAAWKSAQLVYSDAGAYVEQLQKVMNKSNTQSPYYQEAAFQLSVHYMRQAGRLHKTMPDTAANFWKDAKATSINVDDERKPALDAMIADSFENFIKGLGNYES